MRSVARWRCRLACCLLLGACGRHAPVTLRVVEGRLEATRYVSPAAYEHYLRARLLLARGSVWRAVAELKASLAYDEASPFLHCELARALRTVGQLAAARRHIDRAFELQQDFPDALLLRGDDLRDAGRANDAERAYQACLLAAPGHLTCTRRLAGLLDETGRTESAKRLLERLVHGSGGRKGRQELARLCLQRLALSCAARHYEKLAETTGDLQALVLAARIARAQGRSTRALSLLAGPKEARRQLTRYILPELLSSAAALRGEQHINELVERARLVMSMQTLARLLLEAGLPAQALALTDPEVEDQTTELHVLRALALEQLGRVDKLRDLLQHLSRRPPLSTSDTAELVRLLLRQGSGANALRLLENLARRHPKDDLVWLELARAHVSLGDPSAAVRLLRRALESSSAGFTLRLALAAALERMGRWQEAVALAREVLVAQPENAAAHNLIGFILAERGVRLGEAERAIQLAFRSEPLEPYIIDSLAWLRYAQGRVQEAHDLLQIAHRLDPQNAEIAAHLATVRAELGDPTGAITLFRRAMARCEDRGLRSRWRQQVQRLEASRVEAADLR